MPLSLSLKEQSEEKFPYFAIDFDAYASEQMKEILADENYSNVRQQPNIAELYSLLQEIENPVYDSTEQLFIFEEEQQYTNHIIALYDTGPDEYIVIDIEGNNNNLFEY